VDHQIVVLPQRPPAVAAGEVLPSGPGQKADAGDAPDQQLALGRARHPNCHVRLALDEVHHRALCGQEQLDARMLLPECGEARGEHHRPQTVRSAEAHRALRPIVEPIELALQGVDLRLDHLRPLEREEPRRGERVATAAGLEQRGVEDLGQPRHPPADGALVHSQLPRRRGEGARAVNGEEDPQVVPGLHAGMHTRVRSLA
jgi:hypothetical protein